MKEKQRHLKNQRFVSTTGKNLYLLTSAGEAAVIDVSEAYDEVCQILDQVGIGLRYLLVTHAHKDHLKVLSELKRKYGGTFCLHEYEHELLIESGSGDLTTMGNEGWIQCLRSA